MSTFIDNDNFSDQEPAAQDKRSRAEIAADFARHLLMHRHRGVINCDGYFVVFGNDGYSEDQRSRIESAEVWRKLRQFVTESGVSGDGYTWAIVLTDHTRQLFDEEELDHLVWDTWLEICNEYGQGPVGQESKSDFISRRLREGQIAMGLDPNVLLGPHESNAK